MNWMNLAIAVHVLIATATSASARARRAIAWVSSSMRANSSAERSLCSSRIFSSDISWLAAVRFLSTTARRAAR